MFKIKNPPFGEMARQKAVLEAAGVVFTKTEENHWTAYYDGEFIGNARLLVECIKQAQCALGGDC